MVYFSRMSFARCLLFPLIREKVSSEIRKSQEDICKGKVSMETWASYHWNFDELPLDTFPNIQW